RQLVVGRLCRRGWRRRDLLRRSQLGSGLIGDAFRFGGRGSKLFVVFRFVCFGFDLGRGLGIGFRLYVLCGHLLLSGGEGGVRLIGRLFRLADRFAVYLCRSGLVRDVPLGRRHLPTALLCFV